MDFTRVDWTALGVVVGLWWGVYAFIRWTPHPLPWWKKHRHLKKPEDDEPQDLINTSCCKWGRRKAVANSIVIPIYQFIFNFIGGFAGCIGLGLFFHRFARHHLGWQELALLFLAVAGVMGKFAEVMYAIPNLLKAWADKQGRSKS